MVTPTPQLRPNLLRSRSFVFIDGSRIFQAPRELGEGGHLDYALLRDLLADEFDLSHSPTAVEWVFWTSVAPNNTGQLRFLDYVERLGWRTRRFPPSQGYVVDPNGIPGFPSDSHARSRLLRFDAGISFEIGRVADHSKVVALSDSFALADPLLRAARLGRHQNGLAFLGRALDARWHPILRSNEEHLRFLDLDRYRDRLFKAGKGGSSAFGDDYVLGG